MTNKEIIDETFSGLVSPTEIHAVGRPDIEADRPGNVLVDEVRKFSSEGGFKRIAEERNARRVELEESDRNTPKKEVSNFGLRPQVEGSKDFDMSDGDE